MEKEKLVEELRAINNDVSEWLKFGEAKHAGVFAVWTALVIAIISSETYWRQDNEIKMIIIIPLIGILISCLAFLPFTNRIAVIKGLCYIKYKNIKSENILFYQNIFIVAGCEKDRKMGIDNYKKLLKRNYEIEMEGELIDNYIQQIIDISTVATIKFYLFNWSIKYIVISVVLAVVWVMGILSIN